MKTVITGTSQGIGLASARLFVSLGHEVHGLDVLPATLVSPSYTHHVCDLSDIATMPEIAGVQVIVNCAGTTQPDRCWEVNVKGLFNVEDMYISESTSSVLNVASLSAHLGIEGREYVASKGAVVSYTRYLAKKMAAWGGRANSVSPGAILTPMNAEILADSSKTAEVASQNLLGRWASAEETAAVCCFIALEASFMTGQDVVLDGGESFNHFEVKA